MLAQTQYRIFILLFIIFGSLALVFSVCGKSWIQSGDINSGLWENCSKNNTVCVDIDVNELYWIPTVRGLMLTGLALLTICIIYYICLISSPKAFSSVVLSLLSGASVIASIAGISFYTQYNSDSTNSFDYHWAYWLGWIGIVLNFIATVMAVYDSRRPPSPFANAHRLK